MTSPTCRRLALLAALLLPGALGAQVGKTLGVLEANTAAVADIAKLPHMDDSLAAQLVAKRPFLKVADLDAFLAPKLSKEARADLYGRLWLHLDLNTATRDEILLVPGLGPRMAREFLEYRPYRTMAQFRREIGKYVNEAEVTRLEQFVFVPLDLNTATDEELMTIPGLGPRMLREFKEYRPYKSIEQFRREIGKYVPPAEVARLERYVVIR